METNYVDVIDYICEKMGIAASEAAKLVPEIVRRGTISSGLSVIISIILSVVCAVAIVKAVVSLNKASRDYHYKEWGDCDGIFEIAVIVVGCVVLICAVFAFFINLWDFVSWVCAPNASAIAWVLNLFGD